MIPLLIIVKNILFHHILYAILSYIKRLPKYVFIRLMVL